MKALSLCVLCLFCAAVMAQTRVPLKTGATSTQTQLAATLGNPNDKMDLWQRNGTINPAVLGSFSAAERSEYTLVNGTPEYDMRNNFKTAQDLRGMLYEVSRMNSSVVTAIGNMFTSPSTFPTSLIRVVPLFVFSAMKVVVLKNVSTGFSLIQRTAFCRRMLEEHLDGETAELIMRGFDCLPIFVSTSLGGRADPEIAAAIMHGLKKRKPRSSWTNNDWTSFLDLVQGADPEDFMPMPCAIVTLNLAKMAARVDRIGPRLRYAIVDKIAQCLSGLSRATLVQLRALKPIIRHLPPSLLADLPKPVLASMARDLAVEKMDSDKRNELTQLLVQQMGAPQNWTQQQIKEAGPFLATLESTLGKINVMKIKSAVEDFGRVEMKPRKAAIAMKRLLTDSKLQHPGNWSNATLLRQAKNLLCGMDLSFIRQLNGTHLAQAIDDLADVEFTKAQKREIWMKIKPHIQKPLSSLNKTEITKFRRFLTALSSEEMNRLNASELRDALAEIGDAIGLTKSKRQFALNKLDKLAGGVQGNLDKLGSFAKRVPTRVLKNATASVLSLSGDKQTNMDCSDDQCKELFKRFKQQLGNVSDPKFSVKRVKNMGKTILGMSDDDVKDLPKGRVLNAIVDQVCKFAERNAGPQALMQALALKMKAVLNTTAPNVTMRIDRRVILRMRCLFKYFSEHELAAFGKGHCPNIVSLLGNVPMDDIPRKVKNTLLKFAFSCFNKTSANAKVDSETFAKFGDIMCGLDEEMMTKLNATVLWDSITKLGRRCELPADLRRKMLDKFKKEFNVSLAHVEARDIRKLGTLLADLTTTELQQIPAHVMRDVCDAFADEVEMWRDNEKSRQEKGNKDESSAGDKKLFKDGRDRVARHCLSLQQAAAANASTGAVGRRRRQASSSSLTCSQMMAMGSSVTALTSSQILAMPDTEFINCADFLGNETEWTTAQKADLATVAKRSTTWGTPSTWTTQNLEDAGTIAQGLSAAEIATFTLNSMDGIGELGNYDGWSSSQLTNGFAKWLQDYKSGAVASVNGSELSTLGHFACGATSAQIASIPAAEYATAASDIGQLDSCSSTLSDWAAHAVSSFGAVSSWTASDVSTVGVVVGGLSSADLATLSATQVRSISVSVIPILPSATLASLSTTQLGYMSSAQASAVTSTQQAGMSSAQLLVLESLGATLYTSGSALVLPALLTPLLCIAARLL